MNRFMNAARDASLPELGAFSPYRSVVGNGHTTGAGSGTPGATGWPPPWCGAARRP